MATNNINLEGNNFNECNVTIQQITERYKEVSTFYGFPELSETIDNRAADVEELRKLISKHGKVLITGIGGIGKTTLATLCAKKWVQDGIYKYAVFVNIETNDSAKVVYQRLAELVLNTKVYSDNIIGEVYEFYNQHNTLFILDNIEANRVLPKYLPSDKLTNICLIGTSQFTELSKLFNLYPIQTLSEEASFNLIQTIFKNNDIQISTEVIQMIKDLIHKLGNHPLALQHAAALIIDMTNYDNLSLKMSLTEYNEQFDILFRSEFPEEYVTNYNKSVHTALELNIRKAIKSDKEKHVQTLLFCIAYLDPTKIDIDMFYKSHVFNEKNIFKSVRELKKYSIVSVNKVNQITLHRLIQTVCHIMITEVERKCCLIHILNIFFYYEDTYYIHLIRNHFYYLILNLEENFNINKEALSKLYIELFYKNAKLISHLTARLKMINCEISEIEDWSIQQYCVFAQHETFFYYFNTSSGIDNNIYISQILKDSRIKLFTGGKSLVDLYKTNTTDINKPYLKHLTILSICAAFDVYNAEFNALINLGCDINLPDNNGMTPILWAARNMAYNLVFLLHQRGAKYDKKYNKLLFAASVGDHESVLRLLRTNKDYAVSDFGKTLLWWATDKKHYDVLRELIQQGTVISGDHAKLGKMLQLAASKGLLEVIVQLIRMDVDINIVNCDGFTPLLQAVYEGHPKVVAELIHAGADINIVNSHGRTPLLLAVYKKHHCVVAELIRANVDVNIANYYGDTPLLSAIFNGHNEIISMLIHGGADVNMANNDGNTPLWLAAYNGYHEIVAMLISAGVNVNTDHNNRKSPLFISVDKGYKEVVAMLIQAGADVNIIDSNVNTPLLIAANKGHKEIVADLIRAGADINIVNSFGKTPLLLAVCKGHQEVVAELIHAGADVNIINSHGNPPLLLAAYHGYHEVVTELIHAGANINIVKSHSDSSLLSSAEKEQRIIVAAQIRMGFNVNYISHGSTPLSVAAYKGHNEVVAQLIKSGANVNIVNSNGDTPLWLAVYRGHLKVVIELIHSGADVNILNSDGNTPLLYVVYYGLYNIFLELLRAGSDINVVDSKRNTPLLCATRTSRFKMVTELIRAGDDVNAVDSDGNSPLLLAAFSGSREVVAELIHAGANINIINVDGNTPLLFASFTGNYNVIVELIRAGSDVNIQNKKGETPLSVCDVRGYHKAMTELIRAGAVNVKM